MLHTNFAVHELPRLRPEQAPFVTLSVIFIRKRQFTAKRDFSDDGQLRLGKFSIHFLADALNQRTKRLHCFGGPFPANAHKTSNVPSKQILELDCYAPRAALSGGGAQTKKGAASF